MLKTQAHLWHIGSFTCKIYFSETHWIQHRQFIMEFQIIPFSTLPKISITSMKVHAINTERKKIDLFDIKHGIFNFADWQSFNIWLEKLIWRKATNLLLAWVIYLLWRGFAPVGTVLLSSSNTLSASPPSIPYRMLSLVGGIGKGASSITTTLFRELSTTVELDIMRTARMIHHHHRIPSFLPTMTSTKILQPLQTNKWSIVQLKCGACQPEQIWSGWLEQHAGMNTNSISAVPTSLKLEEEEVDDS